MPIHFWDPELNVNRTIDGPPARRQPMLQPRGGASAGGPGFFVPPPFTVVAVHPECSVKHCKRRITPSPSGVRGRPKTRCDLHQQKRAAR